jgi:hypothetical protein
MSSSSFRCRDLQPTSHNLTRVLQHVRDEPMPLGGGVMYYHKQRPQGRLPKVVKGLTAQDLRDDGVCKEPWHTLTLALAYLACGGLDETHDTVQVSSSSVFNRQSRRAMLRC